MFPPCPVCFPGAGIPMTLSVFLSCPPLPFWQLPPKVAFQTAVEVAVDKQAQR